ncbi:MAG: protein-glutamate O-methyltransferase CheR [Deltaproteobacteria bacterium]|nr:protein-glutamate O-methyltransferase CheR [Deltaproteobacteria bacterium]MBT6489587.1 protein-glutamate O-methyltransferase CheR [Deltaproteobacteria bacterium]
MALQQSDFDFVQKLIQQKAAIVLDNGKQYFVESRLTPLAQNTGHDSIEKLILALRQNPHNSRMIEQVVEAITIHETSFFRDIHPFKCMKEVVMPSLLEKRASQHTLNLWCAACSSGQEPYTVTMLLRENFPQLQSWNVRFIATDISNQILGRAREGKFSQLEVNRGLPAPMLLKHFEKQGLVWQIKPLLRSSIEFRKLNLIDNWPPMPKMDVVFLRNVLIYFDVETKRKILGEVRKLLNPDGFLFLGAAEMPMSIDNAFERIDYPRSGCYKLRQT